MNISAIIKNVFFWFLKEFKQDGSYLVPLRVFLGIGWVRASIEKIEDPIWSEKNGKLKNLLEESINNGIAFNFYEEFLIEIIIPNIEIWANIIIIGQALCGVSLILGAFTNLGLLGAMFMNFNFILIGAVNPSVFYIIVQLVLLISNNGHIFGLDKWISMYLRTSYIVAHIDNTKYWRKNERWGYSIGALSFLIVSIISFPKIESFDAHSVDDPDMILFILGTLCASCLIIGILRLESIDLKKDLE